MTRTTALFMKPSEAYLELFIPSNCPMADHQYTRQILHLTNAHKNKLLTLDSCFLLTWPLAAGRVAICCSSLFHSAVGAALSYCQVKVADQLSCHHNHPPISKCVFIIASLPNVQVWFWESWKKRKKQRCRSWNQNATMLEVELATLFKEDL